MISRCVCTLRLPWSLAGLNYTATPPNLADGLQHTVTLYKVGGADDDELIGGLVPHRVGATGGAEGGHDLRLHTHARTWTALQQQMGCHEAAQFRTVRVHSARARPAARVIHGLAACRVHN